MGPIQQRWQTSAAAKGIAEIEEGVTSATGSELIGNLAGNIAAGLGGALVGGTAGAATGSAVQLYNQSVDDERQLTGESRSSGPLSQSPWDLILQGIANGLSAVFGMPGEPPTTSAGGVLVNGAGQVANAVAGTPGYAPGNATLSSGGDNGNAQGSNGSAGTSNTSDLQNAANQPINDSGLSAAARAWDKHAGRPGGTFEPLTGSITDKNAAASEFVNQVLNDPSTTQTNLSRGCVEFRLPNGQGIRFNADGSFSGFLDPRNKVNRMTGFSIDFVSDMDHEHLMAEISFNGQRLCVLDKEGGNDSMEIEFLADLYVLPESVRMRFSLAEFLKTIEIARSDLEKCA